MRSTLAALALAVATLFIAPSAFAAATIAQPMQPSTSCSSDNRPNSASDPMKSATLRIIPLNATPADFPQGRGVAASVYLCGPRAAEVIDYVLVVKAYRFANSTSPNNPPGNLLSYINDNGQLVSTVPFPPKPDEIIRDGGASVTLPIVYSTMPAAITITPFNRAGAVIGSPVYMPVR